MAKFRVIRRARPSAVPPTSYHERTIEYVADSSVIPCEDGIIIDLQVCRPGTDPRHPQEVRVCLPQDGDEVYWMTDEGGETTKKLWWPLSRRQVYLMLAGGKPARTEEPQEVRQ